MNNDVTFEEFIQSHLKRKIMTTRQEGVGWEEGTWAPPFFLKQPVTNVQRDHRLKEKKNSTKSPHFPLPGYKRL